MPFPATAGRRPFGPVLLLMLAFVAGAWAERHGWLPGSTSHEPPGLGDTFAPFWQTWHLVERYYVDRKAVQPQRMTRGAIEGMLNSLGDVGHTSYLSPDEKKQMESSLAGKLEGIGARISLRQGRPTIVNTLPGSPAEKAGLRPGDALLEVDGKDTGSLPLVRVIELVRGQPGTVVRLAVGREGQAEPLKFDITRAEVKVPEVTWHMLPGVPVAHVALHEFGEHADEQLKAALKEAAEKGAKGILLDVRGNPGGLKDQAVAVTSEFLKGGTVFIQRDAAGHQKPVPVSAGGVATEIPLVLLIDEGTASSAEILAGALQDHRRAKLVGTRTFGTGTVLKPFELSDGSAVMLAVAEWLTPDGRQIWHQGIKPDVEVALPPGTPALQPETEGSLDAAGLEKSGDKPLLKGLEVLKEQLR